MSRAFTGTVMTEGNLRRQIIFFALPVFIGNLFQQMYNTVDSLIVGNFLGQKALAAVTSTGSLTFLLVGFFVGFSNGASVIVLCNRPMSECNATAVAGKLSKLLMR